MKQIFSWFLFQYLNFSLSEIEKINFDDCFSYQLAQEKQRLIFGKGGEISKLTKYFNYLTSDQKEKMELKIDSVKNILKLKYHRRLESIL